MNKENKNEVPNEFRVSSLFLMACVFTRIMAVNSEWSKQPIALDWYLWAAACVFVFILLLYVVGHPFAHAYNEHLDKWGPLRKYPALRNAHMIALYFIVNAMFWSYWHSNYTAPPTIPEQYELRDVIAMFDDYTVRDFVISYVRDHFAQDEIIELFLR